MKRRHAWTTKPMQVNLIAIFCAKELEGVLQRYDQKAGASVRVIQQIVLNASKTVENFIPERRIKIWKQTFDQS